MLVKKWIPLGQNVLLKEIPKEVRMTTCGLYLETSHDDANSIEKDSYDAKILEVVAIGEDVKSVEVGQMVITMEGCSMPINNSDGEVLSVCHADNIIVKSEKG